MICGTLSSIRSWRYLTSRLRYYTEAQRPWLLPNSARKLESHFSAHIVLTTGFSLLDLSSNTNKSTVDHLRVLSVWTCDPLESGQKHLIRTCHFHSGSPLDLRAYSTMRRNRDNREYDVSLECRFGRAQCWYVNDCGSKLMTKNDTKKHDDSRGRVDFWTRCL